MNNESIATLIDGFTGKPIAPQPINPFADSEAKREGVVYTTIVLSSDN